MADSSTFHGKRLRRLSKTISAWNTVTSDHSRSSGDQDGDKRR
jgi:hypothetical protein